MDQEAATRENEHFPRFVFIVFLLSYEECMTLLSTSSLDMFFESLSRSEAGPS